MRQFLFALTLFVLSGCNQKELLEKVSSPETQILVKSFIDKLRARDIDGIEQASDETIKSPALRETLMKMADSIPAQEPASVKLVGAQAFNVPGKKTINTTFEYGFGEKWFLINVALQEKDGAKTIVGFNVVPQEKSLESQHHFTLSGKGTPHYIVLGMAIIGALLTLYSLIVCIKTRLSGRKWPWILFILFGFGKVTINWATGQWGIAPLSFQLFSASAFAPLYGPWTVAASLPIGAILFLVYRTRLTNTTAS